MIVPDCNSFNYVLSLTHIHKVLVVWALMECLHKSQKRCCQTSFICTVLKCGENISMSWLLQSGHLLVYNDVSSIQFRSGVAEVSHCFKRFWKIYKKLLQCNSNKFKHFKNNYTVLRRVYKCRCCRIQKDLKITWQFFHSYSRDVCDLLYL